ncbi:MAG: hypothetical protein AAF915_17350 [Cyanobacteria bacterium P01_D01_bin.50]
MGTLDGFFHQWQEAFNPLASLGISKKQELVKIFNNYMQLIE